MSHAKQRPTGDASGALRLVERFLERLSADPAGDPAEALALLVRELPAYGACLVEWPHDAEPTVLAASGMIHDVGGYEPLLALVREAQRGSGTFAGVFRDQRPFGAAVYSAPGRPPIVLAAWVDLEEQPELEALLRPLPVLVDRFQRRRSSVEAVTPRRALAFPEGYVPGDSPLMTEMYRQMEYLLQGDLPVLIVGDTGVGKESVARTLHASSSRHAGPFVAVNCAAIPADLLEAEMFGIAKGVATGVNERAGKFQAAQGGTLFLDEIGDMPQPLQPKLLRALQEKEIHPVGGTPVKVDIRVVASTNTDLARSIEQGRFRSDLYYRIAGFVLRVPRLADRRGHVPRLVEDFLRTFEREAGKRVHGVSLRAMRALSVYSWPGNVRELEHEVRRLVYLCAEGEVIDTPLLSPHIREPRPHAPGESDAASDDVTALGDLSLEDNLARLERQLVTEALRRSGGNRTQAARLLGVSRNGLAIKMERLGLLSEPG